MFANRNQIGLFLLGVVFLVGVCLQIGNWWPLLVLPVGVAFGLYYARKGMISG